VAQRLREDVEALAGIERGSATAGERESAEWVAGRLREAGAEGVRLESYRYQPTFAYAHFVHYVAGMLRSRLGAWTDPVLARLAGVPAVSILSVKDGGFPNYHLQSDVPEHVDYGCAERCVAAVLRIGEGFSG
jgi:hypothetical protein